MNAVTLVYDSARKKLYAAVNSNDSTHPNTVAIIDPSTGTVESTIAVGESPRVLALSQDGKYLFVGLEGVTEVERIDLATNTINLRIPLVSDGVGPIVAHDIAVMPGNSGTIAVARKYQGGGGSTIGTLIFDGATPRPVASTDARDLGGSPDQILFSDSPGLLYGLDNFVSTFGFTRLTISSDGIRVQDTVGSMFGSGYYQTMAYSGGRIYSSLGGVADPVQDVLVGKFPLNATSGGVAADASSGIVSYLDVFPQTSNQGKKTVTIEQFDSKTFLPVGTIQADVPPNTGAAEKLVACGNSGFAFVVDGEVVITSAGQTAANLTPPTIDNLAINHMVYDDSRGRIYASVPASGGAKANTVAVINSLSKTIEGFIPVGSDPDVLVLSSDNQYLYVGVTGSAAISRIDLNRQVMDLQFPLGFDGFSGPRAARSIAAMPGAPQTIAVSMKYLNGNSPDYAGVAIFDDGVRRTDMQTGFQTGDSIAFNGNGTVLYEFNQQVSGEVFAAQVDSAGVRYGSGIPQAIRDNGASISFADGNLYSTNGVRLEPTTPKMMGVYSVGLSRGMALDGNTVYFLADSSSGKSALFSFDRQKYLLTGYQDLSITQGHGFDLVKTGSTGFALTTGTGVTFTGPSFTPIGGPSLANLPVNHLIVDKARGHVYASVPSRAGNIGNSIATIDPVTKTILSTIYVGSEPESMALSADGSLLYVGLHGSASVVVVNLASQSVDSTFDIPFDSEGPQYASRMSVKPDDPYSVAVLVGRPYGWSPNFSKLTMYDHGQSLPTEVPGPFETINSITFGSSGSELYGYNNETTGFDFYKFGVDLSGVAISSKFQNFIYGFGATLTFDDGLVQSSNGYAIDPASNSIAGTYPGVNVASSAAFDNSQAYFVYRDILTTPSVNVSVYDKTNFTRLGSFGVPQATGNPYDLIRYDTAGLMFATNDDHVVFASVPTLTPPQASLASLPANRMVYDSVRQRIYASIPGSAPALGNTIAIINPVSSAVEASIPIGSEPNELVLSDDGLYLYATMLGTNKVKKVDLSTRTVVQTINMGWSSQGGTLYAHGLAVMPGNSSIVAITSATKNFVPSFNDAALYSNGVKLPNTIGFRSCNADLLAFSASSGTLYGMDAETTQQTFCLLNSDGKGLSVASVNYPVTFFRDVTVNGGLVYSAYGTVVDPDTKSVKGTFPLSGTGVSVAVDSNRAIFLVQDSTNGWSIQAFDKSTHQGTSTTRLSGFTTGNDIVRFGTDGVAVATNSQIILLRGIQ